MPTSEDEINRYMHEFIDPIFYTVADPLYKDIKIVTIIDPDALPNLITNMDIPECQEAAGPGGYIDGIQYAVSALSRIPNVYIYMDIAQSGWLGWDTNLEPAATLISDCVKETTKGINSIAGFASNIGYYTPTDEIFLPDPLLTLTEEGRRIASADFYEWNNYFDELSYTKAMFDAFVTRGFPESIGMLIDTSRNGWGGPDRPTAVSTSTDINTYVDESRVDRRYHRGNWCNQSAGIGERPAANPGAEHIDAYVWIKPPGESDGVSDPGFEPDPDNPGLQHDSMCDPDGVNSYCNCVPTGAIEAPHFSRWNQEHFDLLLQNAYPPIE